MAKTEQAVKRLDILLVDKGLARSRTLAKKLIQDGLVSIACGARAQILVKPSMLVDVDAVLHVKRSDEDRYASRAGLKLESALGYIDTPLEHMLALDVGQSTGGFTDCLLTAGVSKVVGIEVGHNQLLESLRENPKVVCLEGVNARYLKDEPLEKYAPNKFDLAVIDVSFISQTLLLPSVVYWLKPNGWLVSLVKPQFEVGKDGVGKGGIVKSPSLHEAVKHKITQIIINMGLTIVAYRESPIEGGDGNKEFLLIARF